MPRVVGTILSGWRRFYGANPLHLIAVLAGGALVWYTVSFVTTESMATWMLVWFLGALVAHDLVLFPLYALADRSLLVGRWARRRITGRHEPRVPVINHVRVPVMGSGLLLLVFLPVIIGQGESAYVTATGMSTEPYFERWLWISGVLFAASAVIYVVRLASVAAVSLRDISRAKAKAVAARTRKKAAADDTPVRSKEEAPASESPPPRQDPPAGARPAAADGGASRLVNPEPERATIDEQDGTAGPHSDDARE